MSSAGSNVQQTVASVAAANVVLKLAQAPEGPQVVLLYGERGGDADQLAMTLARSWMCVGDKTPGGCGQCPICRSFDSGRAVDFQKIVPYGAGRLIRLGSIHFVENEPLPKFEGIPAIDFFRTRPLMARAKVIWFDPADRFGHDTSNALLKTLEELPNHGRVVMTTADLGKVLATVRSRSLCVACDLPANLEVLVGELSESERAFARTQGDIDKIRAVPEAYASLHQLFLRTLSAPVGAAPALAEEARDIAAKLADKSGEGARWGHLEVLSLLAGWWVAHRPDDPSKTAAVIEAHRLVGGNVTANAVFDMVYARLLV